MRSQEKPVLRILILTAEKLEILDSHLKAFYNAASFCSSERLNAGDFSVYWQPDLDNINIMLSAQVILSFCPHRLEA